MNDSDDAQVLVVNPSIGLVKVAYPTTILVGHSVAYTCTVRNTGDVALGDVELDDNQFPWLDMTPDSGDVDRDGLLDRQETWVYRLVVKALNEDTINIATISGQPCDAAGRAYPGIDRVSAEAQASVDVIAPAIDIVKTVSPTIVYAGDLVTYTIEVVNSGDVPLVDVDLLDDQCAELVPSDGGNDALLMPGETWRYQCRAHPLADVVNVAQVSAQPSDSAGNPYSSMNRVSAEDSASVDVVAPGIAIGKGASRPVVLAGEDVTYHYVITNTGDVPLADVSLVDDRCQAIDPVGGDRDQDGLLDVGEAWTYTCDAVLTEDTLNTARASGQPSDGGGQPLPGIHREGAEATAFVRVIDPQIDVIKTAYPLRLYAGETVTYSYRLEASGDVPLRDVTLTDDMCAGVEMLDGDDDFDGLLDPGEIWNYRCTQTLRVDTINTAVATGQPCDTDGRAFAGIEPVTDTAEATVDVIEPECAELFPHEGFEEPLSTRWYTTPGVSRSTARAQNGSYSLKMGDGILDNERAAVAFVVPTEAEILTLSFFWSAQSTEYQRGQDQLIVYVTNPDGDIVAEVARLDARDQQVSWQLAARDLRPYAEQAYGLLFECVTNSSRPTVFYLDNLEVKLCSFDLPFGCAVLDYYFHEEYNDAAMSQWRWDLGSGSYAIDDSVITLRPEDDDVNRFPVFWTNDAFPLRENFVFEARFRFNNITPYGTTVGIGAKYYYGARYYEGSEPPPEIENILSIHHLDTGYWVALMEQKLWQGDVTDESWHTVQLIRREYTWILKVDGQLVGEVRSTTNPRSLYIGNPAIERFDGDWTYLNVDYLRVTACMGQGIVQVWEPLVLNQTP